MGRWRAPQKQAAPYITAAGYSALEAQVKTLWKRRWAVVKHLAAAAAEGDRSENAEYIYRKKELREIDWRLGYLQRRMPTLKIVSSRPDDLNKVFFAAEVTLEDEQGKSAQYRIVGADEAEAGRGDISVDAPLAKALLGKKLDDEVVLSIDGVERRYEIMAIAYHLD